jgi:putative ABC transport system ATP-binding protein
MLRITDLVAGYGRTPIARLAALTAAPGEAALLIGASGIGKTTVLLAIAGHARRFSGHVDLPNWTPRTAPAGFIFQDLHLVAGLTALENVLIAPFALGKRQDRTRARALLEQLGLSAVTTQPAERLSRGQAQRVAIARALLMQPPLLLADEPTASLDDDACLDVLALLLQAARDTGAPLLIATHDARVKTAVPRQARVERAT